MHALEALKLLDLVTGVTAIWGEKQTPPGTTPLPGRYQYRISVTLIEGARELLDNNGFTLGEKGAHVIMSDGEVRGSDDSDTARQLGYPSMQVSWLKENPTVGEIDIDYIEFRAPECRFRFLSFLLDLGNCILSLRDSVVVFFGGGHLNPKNSDVRAHLQFSSSNYEEHVRRYGCLNRWWSDEETTTETESGMEPDCPSASAPEATSRPAPKEMRPSKPLSSAPRPI